MKSTFFFSLLSVLAVSFMAGVTVAQRECGMNHELVGKSWELINRSHDTTGTISIVDLCTMNVRSYSQGSSGPSVYFRDLAGDKRVSSSRIDGTPKNIDFSVQLDAPFEFGDFETLSVYCEAFKLNFADTQLCSNTNATGFIGCSATLLANETSNTTVSTLAPLPSLASGLPGLTFVAIIGVFGSSLLFHL